MSVILLTATHIMKPLYSHCIYKCIILNQPHNVYNQYLCIEHIFNMQLIDKLGNDSNLLIVFYVQIMPDDLVMQLHRF